jgi:predicted lipopolysaccharide heptosyltransferase III
MAPALNAPRILVIRRRYIGDLVLITPLLANLKLHWPQAEITVLVDEGYEDILRLNANADHLLTIPRKGPRRFQRDFALLRTLRKRHFTHVFDLDTNDRTAFLTWITGAAFRASYTSDKHRWRRSLAYNHVRDVPLAEYNSASILENYLRLLPLAGVPVVRHDCELEPTPESVQRAEAAFAPSAPGRRVLLHPGSRSAYRIWPLERFARVADRLHTEAGAQVFLTGGPAENKLIEGIRSAARTPLTVLPPPADVGQFAAYARVADAFLCHDSGPMHIAAAVGTKVVALFSAQSTTLWSPAGPGHQVLQASMPCAAACVAPDECDPNNGYKSYCVRRITEDQVFSAVLAALNR